MRRPGPGLPRPAGPGQGHAAQVRAPVRGPRADRHRGHRRLRRRRAQRELPERRRELPARPSSEGTWADEPGAGAAAGGVHLASLASNEAGSHPATDPAPDRQEPGATPGPEGGMPHMRPYEVMAIFEATTEPTVIQGAARPGARGRSRSTGGNPGAIDRWGQRTFAYEVNHKREGYYVVVEFTGRARDGGRPRPHARAGRRGLRHKIVRLPETRSPQPRAAG